MRRPWVILRHFRNWNISCRTHDGKDGPRTLAERRAGTSSANQLALGLVITDADRCRDGASRRSCGPAAASRSSIGHSPRLTVQRRHCRRDRRAAPPDGQSARGARPEYARRSRRARRAAHRGRARRAASSRRQQPFALHPALGARADVVNGLDQKIGQIVRQRPAVQMTESGEPCEPGRLRMAAQLVGGLGSDTPPIPLEFVGSTPSNKSAGSRIPRISSSLANAS